MIRVLGRQQANHKVVNAFKRKGTKVTTFSF